MYLQKFSKLMVTTVTPDEVKRTITGNISAKKTGEVIEISAGFEIKDVKRMRSPRKTDDNKSRRLRRRIK